MLIIVCGLPGTGKSTVAKHIQEKTEGIILRTDEIRKRMFDKPDYSEGEKMFVYEEIIKITEVYLKAKKTVIIDATFYKNDMRKPFYSLAERFGTVMKIVLCKCDEKIIEKRIKARTNDPSDANMQIYHKIKDQWEKFDKVPIIVDTGMEWKRELDSVF